MLITKITKALIVSTLSIVFIAACGGGGDDSSSDSNNTTPPPVSKVSLSGTVQVGDVGTTNTKTGLRKAEPSYATVTTADFQLGTNLANAIVIAVDSDGNTETAVTSSTGQFTLSLSPDKVYALIFIDTRTMEVIGSLVQAANTTTSGAVNLSADTELGHIVVDPVEGIAVSEGDVTGTVTVDDADSLDTDGDGVITQDDITTLQVNTLSTSSDTLSSISVLNFLGDANTWRIQEDRWGDETSRRIIVSRDAKVAGPDGSLVNAIKEAEVPYYVQADWDQSGTFELWEPNGYYDSDGGWDDINQTWVEFYNNPTTLASPPAAYSWESGIWGWAQYRYVDVAANKVRMGERDWNSDTVNWGGFALPLNFAPGSPATATETDTWQECSWDPVLGDVCVDVIQTLDQNITVSFASNADGSPALIVDTTGKSLPVVKVSVSGTYTVTADGIEMDSGVINEAFYIVAKYGAQAPAMDVTGAPLPWDTAMSRARFGTIATDNTIVSTTPASIGPNSVATNVGTQPFPEATQPLNGSSAGSLTLAELRNEWLVFLSDNIDIIDFNTFDGSAGSANSAYFWLDWQEDQPAPVTPASWDPTTYMGYSLEEGTLKQLDYNGNIIATPTNISAEIRYMDSTATAQFSFEWRKWVCDTSTCETGSLVSLGSPATGTLGTPLDPLTGSACDPTVQECKTTLSAPGSFVAPTLSVISAATGGGDIWEEWIWNAVTASYDIYQASGAELWIIMDDPSNGIFNEMPAEWYNIRANAPTQTNQKLSLR